MNPSSSQPSDCRSIRVCGVFHVAKKIGISFVTYGVRVSADELIQGRVGAALINWGQPQTLSTACLSRLLYGGVRV